ncbi:MAG TPA: chemotaxis protein CheX [Firmicutes bacterium]|nr:chemotaxis protein CheX [Bacillota bacterium]
MNVEFLNPFLVAIRDVLESELGEAPQIGSLATEQSSFTSDDVTVLVGVTGTVEGVVFYGMAEQTACRLAAAMMGTPVPMLDSLAESAIAELGNMIAGRASAGLEEAGFNSRLAPPSVIHGRGAIISTIEIRRLVVPVTTGKGEIRVHLALRLDSSTQGRSSRA